MPGKSRHGKGKHLHHSKKSKAKQRYGTMALQQPVAADIPKPVATTGTPPSSRAPTSPATSRTVQYPYITTELRRIGILAGIILVILIVLALVLS
jgi:hypothetical protein